MLSILKNMVSRYHSSSMRKRHIIFHHHIFKNAGSTVDQILKKNFKELWQEVEGEHPWSTLDSSYVLEFCKKNPELIAISSHQARWPLPNTSDIHFHPLLFLRHPLDRVGSVYAFEKRQPTTSQSLGARVARENDFEGYVRWRLADGNGAVIKNFQTIFLSGRLKDMRSAVASKEDLISALEHLEQLPTYGIVENFADSIARMGENLGTQFENLDFSYSIENKSNERKADLKDRIADIKDNLSPGLYQELLEKNFFDLEIYEKASKSRIS